MVSDFSFDGVSLKSEMKLAVMIFFNVRVIHVEANLTRSHLDLLNSPFALWSLADVAKIWMQRTQNYVV